jgi:hypothetical protein
VVKKLLFLCIICSLIAFNSCKQKHTTLSNQNKESLSDSLFNDSIQRLSITFILGKDESNRNPYYSLANQYYRINDSDRTEIVVDTIFSLSQVREYLEKNPPKNGHPYGLINLVTHGNEFIDLSVKLSPDGYRTSAEGLLEAIQDSTFKYLDSTIVDNKTLICLHGCAVGKNSDLLKMLSKYFGRQNKPTKVKASKLFEYYTYLSESKNPQMIRHYYAKVWYNYYKMDSIPEDNIIADNLRLKYPKDKLNWLEALRRQHPSNPSEMYHLKFIVPVTYEDFYDTKDQLPSLNSKAKQAKWLESTPEFLTLINKTHIPFNYFQIKFYNTIYKNKTDESYSIKVKAKAGVICLIKPLFLEDDSIKTRFIPFKPAVSDTNYYGYSGF